MNNFSSETMKAEHIALHKKYYGQNLERKIKIEREKYEQLKMEINLEKKEKFSSDTMKAEICRAHCILRIPALPYCFLPNTHTLSYKQKHKHKCKYKSE